MHAFKLNIKVGIIVQIYGKNADLRVHRLHASLNAPKKHRLEKEDLIILKGKTP